MQLADGWLKIDNNGNLVKVSRITPAEAQILKRGFGQVVAGSNEVISPLVHLVILKDEVKRSKVDEFKRLSAKYGQQKTEKAFPGENPNIPDTFAEIKLINTDEAEPKAAKLHEILPLAALPKGDNGQDMAEESEKQSQIDALIEQNKQLMDTVNNLLKQQQQKPVDTGTPGVTSPK